MSNLVIVAIPAEDDLVWKISSEKVPHLTLMFLGETSEDKNVGRMAQFVEHALSINGHGPFYLEVDYRGELGSDKADVLFFEGGWDTKWIKSLRGQLLQQTDIQAAYQSEEQFPGWVPHLTLGYPDAPAKELPEEYNRRLYSVHFDRIAVWDGDYAGPEFRLKWERDELTEAHGSQYDTVMAMSSTNQARIALGLSPRTEDPDVELSHYGVKGMKWGVRGEETKKGMLDPEGHDLGTDVIKSVVWPIVPPLGLFAIPAQVRLVRGGIRGAKAKMTDLEEKRFEKKAESVKNFVEIHNRSGERFNREIEGINKKYPMDLTKDAKAQKRYDDEALDLMQKSYQEAAKSIGNRSKTMHLDISFGNDGMDFAIKAKEGAPTPLPNRVKHGVEIDEDDNVTIDLTGKINRDARGHITGFEFDKDAMAQSMKLGAEFLNKEIGDSATLSHSKTDLGANFLEHYGVKGMRWGQRKDKTPVAVEAKATGKIPHGTKRQTKIQVEGGENHPAAPDAIKTAQIKAKYRKSGPAALNNQELQDLQMRLNLEANVNRLVAPASRIDQGRRFVREFTGLNKEVNDTVGTGLQTVRLVKQVR